jgi:uncharacterized protein (DUF488 family)
MDTIKPNDRKVLFSIGHSNHGLEKFITLLKDNNIEVVADIRSRPYSRFASQFNKAAIKDSLHAHGIRYLFLGDMLGGKPDDKGFYDLDGNVLYSRIIETPEFHHGVERLMKGSKEYRLALMCSEENPLNCHRYHLVSKSLEKRGVDVVHIRGDGNLQSSNELAGETEEDIQMKNQLTLFS